ISVAIAVRRSPPRSSAARGVTATVNSQSPAANGKRTDERALIRMIASPSVSRVRAVLRIHTVRNSGATAVTTVASNMTAADATASHRNLSTSKRKYEAAITSAGKREITASHNALLIWILARFNWDRPGRRHNGVAQPTIQAG